ncbi:hypothetical protein CfE428DRAFT_0478 [Chthoniobacter flavus Ellin428]|uniref:Uncharacterized protein n=1 Tax=Chthoniobacter flavus Ellin428 TaxID=497964 RepID=B4CUW5_9BACT|nr:hypothetical protein [Chthoniobacter flavus]EDY22353.1 hypothetical protein CfE428DRAFT_0478 [Chthoniobacter flavus Ellin428]TCO94634.1 hypothetical protein EV701_102101 [Chthoniobacter flavus]
MKPAQFAAMLFAALLVFYSLSIGPVIRFTHYGLRSPMPRAMAAFYAPVLWLSRYPPIATAVEWYVLLWMPKSEQG